MPSPKILTIVPFPFMPPKKGGEWCAYYSSEFLAKHRPMVLASTSNNKIFPSTFKFIPAFKDNKWKYLSPQTGKSLQQIAVGQPLKGVFLHQPFMGFWAYRLAKRHRVPLMVYVHNLEYQRFKSMGKAWWPALYALESWLYPKADFLLFISDRERERAIEQWKLDPNKCLYVPYGVLQKSTPEYKAIEAKRVLGFDEEKPLFLFFGAMSYKPNQEAVENMLQQLAPAWEKAAYGSANWVICGGGMPKSLQTAIEQQPNFHYMGFVDPLAAYLQAADVMVNPVLSGGGVKTKVMEALSWGTTVVSTEIGAEGIDRTHCSGKLQIAPNQNWEAFASVLKTSMSTSEDALTADFYEQYHWKNILAKVADRAFPPEQW